MSKWLTLGVLALVWGRLGGAHWVILGAWAILCAALAPDRVAAVIGVYPVFSWSLSQLALVWALSGFDWRGAKVGQAAALLSLCLSLIALAQFARHPDFGIWPVSSWHGRLYWPMGSPIALSHLLGILAPLMLGRAGRWTWAAWVAAMIGAQSRGGLLAAGAGLGYLAWTAGRRRRRLLPPAVVLAALGLLLAVTAMRPAAALSDRGRDLTWSAAVSAIRIRPYFGWGPENGIYAITANRGPGWSEVYAADTQDHAHNGVLNAAMSFGLPGAAIFLLWWLQLWRTTRPGRGRAALAGLAAASLFNPVYFSVTAAAMIFSARWRHDPNRVSAPALAALSLAAAGLCLRLMSAAADESLPAMSRLAAAGIVGIVQGH